MKKCSSLYIFLAFVGIIIILLCVVLFAYKPHFGETLSNNNADWGNFGQFFWGLGTMLLTGLSVIVLFVVNKSLNKFYAHQQEKQQEFEKWLETDRQNFQRELEGERIKIQVDMLRQKRIDNWMKIYYQIVLRLATSNIKSDAEWLELLRNLTIIHKSMINEGLFGDENNQEHVAYTLGQINSKIKEVIVESTTPGYDNDGLELYDKHFALSWSIVQLYFNLTSLKELKKLLGE